MSDAKVCDNCGETLVLTERGDDPNGEIAAWIKIAAASTEWDACTRSCAVALLADDGPVRVPLDEWTETVAEIARTVREEREADDD